MQVRLFRPSCLLALVAFFAIATLASIATPAQAQRITEAALIAVQDALPADTPPSPARLFPLPLGEDLIQLPYGVFLLGSEDSRRGSVRRHVTIGALAGAVVGITGLYLTNWSNCTMTGSMCGLVGIPLYGGAGAVVGGAVGYILGRSPK